jgi:hypothetical protein
LLVAAALLVLLTNTSGQGLKNRIPKDQKPLLKVFPPSAAEQSKPGTGKFIIFTREQVGKDWDFIAGAWECIPSQPEKPVTKRAELCHSSWNAEPLLDVLACDDSAGMHPRFARLQVDAGEHFYTVNLYDINYRTWEVRCLWQGSRLAAFGVLDGSIFCHNMDNWMVLNASTGGISKEIPFTPQATDGGFWLVRKPGETGGCWSYDRTKRQFVARFGAIEEPAEGFSRAKLSTDGKSRAWVLAAMPEDWRGGLIAGSFILQRDGQPTDIVVPIEMQASLGSGLPVIPHGIRLAFLPVGKVEFRAWKGVNETEDRTWTIDIATGKVSVGTAPHLRESEDEHAVLSGVPVPEYLRQDVKEFAYFGRGGLAPAFLKHLGILRKAPAYGDCAADVSRDGRHILFRAKEGPLAGVFIYGDLVTKQTVRWPSPKGFDPRDPQEFVWVETP